MILRKIVRNINFNRHAFSLNKLKNLEKLQIDIYA